MPRQTVPLECKRMRTMVVNVTKTTEEDIWNHLMIKIQDYIVEADRIHLKQDEFMSYLINRNPYAGFSWRNDRRPKRVQWDEWQIGSKEWEFEDMMIKHFEFKHDWKLCVKAFAWDNETNSRFEDADYWDFQIMSKHTYDKTQTLEFELYERKYYAESKNEWEVLDAEWIAEYNAKKDHRTNHKKDNTDCKYCIKEVEYDTQCEIRLKEQEEQQKLWDAEWEKKKEQERKEKEESKEMYECKNCGFQTCDDAAWDKHEDSKEHLKVMELARFFCKDCSVQCRNQTEYAIHIQCKKHKIAIGIIEKQIEYKCEKCNYTSSIKQNYDKHCLSKSHKEK